jgi:putative transport protein
MEWIVGVLRSTPELAVFLTLAAGTALGRARIGNFSLGTVTGVLLVGVLVGQLGIDISATVKSTFFLLFLFAIGYSVGPQFVRGLRRDGLPQIVFAAVVCVIILGVTWGAAVVAGFDAGSAAGLLSGANTISAVIGVATDTILQTGGTQAMVNEIPVAYAVTYIFGTAGTAWFLASVGPKLLGGNIVEQSKEYEQAHGGAIESDDPSTEAVYDGAAFRVFELKAAHSVEALEHLLLKRGGWPVYVERVRTAAGVDGDPKPGLRLAAGDRVVLCGPVEVLLRDEGAVGHEVADLELLDFRAGVLNVHVSNKAATRRTLGEMRTVRERHGAVIRRISRGGVQMPLLQNLKLERGDVVELEGRREDVERAAKYLGYAERPTKATDLLYVALGIFLGGLFGSLTLHAGNVPLSFSASGGVLIMGIVFGWLRSTRPRFGYIPEPALWLMNNLGLATFIAVVGIMAGPSFVSGLKASGVSLFVAGVFVSVLPMFFGLLIGRYIFKFHPVINLGANAGARTTTAALGAISERAHSQAPALAYTVTYAVGSIMLTIWGVVIVLLMRL